MVEEKNHDCSVFVFMLTNPNLLSKRNPMSCLVLPTSQHVWFTLLFLLRVNVTAGVKCFLKNYFPER